MNTEAVFIMWQDLGLFIYSILKAFLPLPSLEVILVPLCVHSPQKWLIYSLEGALGTCIGGVIGYLIAYRIGRKALHHIASDEEIAKGERLMRTHGLLAVFIGGITPIPDFLLAYLAGFSKMPLLSFTLCDGFARFLRSLLVTYSLKTLGTFMNVDLYGTWFSIIILVLLLGRWLYTKYKTHRQMTSRK